MHSEVSVLFHLENAVYGLAEGNVQIGSLRKERDVEESLTNVYDCITNPAVITDHHDTVGSRYFGKCDKALMF